MKTEDRIDQLELTVPVLFEILAGVAQATTYLVETVMTTEQKNQFTEWLAVKSSETDGPGRMYFAQLGSTISNQARFEQLLHIAGQEFAEKKHSDLL